MSFAITNTLTAPIRVSGLRYNAPFSVVSGSPMTLAPNQSETFGVRFQPANAGLAEQNLTFVTDQPESTGVNTCRVILKGVGVALPPRVSGPYDYSMTVTSTTIDGNGVSRSCTSNRHHAGVVSLTLRANGSGTVSGTATMQGTEDETGGSCSAGRALEHWNHNYSGSWNGTLDNVQFTIVSRFSTGQSAGSDTLNFAGTFSGGAVTGTLAEVQAFTHTAGNGGGGGSGSTQVTLR